MGLELDKVFNTHKDKTKKVDGVHAWHVFMMSQRIKEGGTGIYRRGFLGIMREAQQGIRVPGLQLGFTLCTDFYAKKEH